MEEDEDAEEYEDVVVDGHREVVDGRVDDEDDDNDFDEVEEIVEMVE